MRQLRLRLHLIAKGILVFTLFLSSSFPVLANANGFRCEDTFKDQLSVLQDPDIVQFSDAVFKQAYKEEYQNIESWLRQKSILLLRNRIKNKVEATCLNGCTQKDISRLIASSIEEAFAKMDKRTIQFKKIRGYALLTGITIGSFIGASYLKVNMPVHLGFLADVIPMVTTLAIWPLAAPLFDQVRALAVRGGYRLHDGKDFFRKNMEFVRMRALNKILREKMTPIEQEEATRLSTLLGQIAPTFGTAIESAQSADRSKGGMSAAAARIADMAIRMREFFPEIPSDDLEVVRTIDMVFTQRMVIEDPANPEALIPDLKSLETIYSLTIKQIEKFDPLYKQSAETAESYRQTIRVWLGLQ